MAVSKYVLTVALFVLFGYAMARGLEMPFRAMMMPVFVAAIALPLIVIALYQDIRRDQKRIIETHDSTADLAMTDSEVTRDAFRRVFGFFIWFGALITGAYLLGFFVALPLLVVIYLLMNKEPMWLSALLGLGVLAILYWGFQVGLVLPLPRGVLTTLLFGV